MNDEEVIINQDEDNMYNELITAYEVKDAIQTLERGKAVGHDNVTELGRKRTDNKHV